MNNLYGTQNSKNISKIITNEKNSIYPFYLNQNNQYGAVNKIETVDGVKTIRPFNSFNQNFEHQNDLYGLRNRNMIKMNQNDNNNLNNFKEEQNNKIITRNIDKIETIYPKENNYIIARNLEIQQNNNFLQSNQNKINNQSQISFNNNSDNLESTYINIRNDNPIYKFNFDFNLINQNKRNDNNNNDSHFQIQNPNNPKNQINSKPLFSIYGDPMNLAAYEFINK